MSYGTTSFDTGPSPDVSVHRDSTGAGLIPTAKLIDATEGSSSPIGVDANPLRVRPRVRGTADYDSGLTAVPTGLTQLTAATVYLQSAFFHNTHATAAITVTVQNTAGLKFLDAVPLGPKEWIRVPLDYRSSLGLHWQVSASGVNGQIIGET